MIIFDLKCSRNHRFEGWFPNSETFEKQRAAGLVTCSACGDVFIERVFSGAHAVGLKAVSAEKNQAPMKHSHEKEVLLNKDPVVLMKMVQRYVEKNFKNVGESFCTQARKMQSGEIPSENICGTATPEERESLMEEEIPFVSIPKLPDSFNN